MRALTRLAILSGLSLPWPVFGTPFEISVALPRPPSENKALQGNLRLAPAGGEVSSEDKAGKTASFTLSADGRSTVRLNLPPGSFWKVTPELPGYWGAEEAFVVQEGHTVAVTLFQTAPLRGELRVPRGQPRAGDLQVSFEPPPRERLERKGSPLPQGVVSCPVKGDGLLRCEVPAGVHDLRVRRSGFASHFRWGIEVPLRKGLDLGTVELRPGASVVGRIEIDGRLLPKTRPKVELRPMSDREAGPLLSPRLEAMGHTAVPDQRGFFQLEGVQAGSYVILATAEGFSPARHLPVRVFEGRETILDAPLRLGPPATLQVLVDPPLNGSGERWDLTLWPLDHSTGTSMAGADGKADADGTWIREGITPGKYSLTVNDERGRSFWFEREITVEAGMVPVEVKIPLVKVRGEITYGGEPRQTRITFGDPGSQRRVEIFSNPQGELEGHLPREGLWNVSVLLLQGGAEQLLEPVEVRRKPGETAAWIELDIEHTKLAGVVLDQRGKPVPRASVSAWRGDNLREVSKADTDEQGRFAFYGLPEGDYKVRGRYERRANDPVEVTVREGEEKEVRLVLPDSVKIQGRVAGPSGPVPGAVVLVFPEVPPNQPAPVDEVVADADGNFEAQVMESASTVNLIVLPPGYAARLVRLPSLPERPFEVPVSEHGGTLVLDLPEFSLESHPALFRGDKVFSLLYLRKWADFHRSPNPLGGGRWVLPMMEAGDYTLCPSFRDRKYCESGFLQPGGELSFSLRAQSGEREPAEAPGGE